MAITLPTVVLMGGGRTKYSGTFVHTVGAAEETFKVGCARIRSVQVANMDSGAKAHPKTSVDFTESVSGNTNTVTVHYLDTVADGRIEVEAQS